MTGELRVDPIPLAKESQGLVGAASGLPLPPAPFTAAGADALSTILNIRLQALEAPLIAGLPVTKAEAMRTAQNILLAAGIYERVDQQLADDILKALFGMPDGTPDTPGAGGAGGGVAGTAGVPASAATAGATPASDATQQAGQLGQMMGMPMQAAAQAAQIPMQVAGMAAAIPQAALQGVQSAMQQVGQMAGSAGETTEAQDPPADKAVKQERAEEDSTEHDGPADAAEKAAPGSSNAERAPAADPQPDEAIESTPARQPAPTRPATSGPESVL